jgi:GT2 family glycosyltransferase
MKASIIIRVFNNYLYTKNCILSLQRQNTFPKNEIIIIDNNSTDQTTNFLSTLTTFSNFKIIKNHSNLVFAKACNQATRIAKGEHLIFLNNDTEVSHGWIEGLARCKLSGRRIGVVGCKLLYPDNTVQHAGVAFSQIRVHHIYRNFHPTHPAVNKHRDFQAVTAACMLVPRELFLSLGGLDESFINGFEDLDFCFRARSKGFKVMYTPESVVIHHESKTPGRHDHHAHNARLFASRWLPSVDHDLDKIYAEDGLRRHVEYEKEIGGKWLEDSNTNHFWYQARSLVVSGDYSEAEKFFGHALSFNPYDVRRLSIAEELSDLYVKWGRIPDAQACLDTIIRVTPSKHLLQKKTLISTMETSSQKDSFQK